MAWVDSIFSFVWDLAFKCYGWSNSIWTWVPGADWFSDRLTDIGDWLWSLLTPIAQFGDFADDVWSKVQNIFTPDMVLQAIKGWFPWLEGVGAWFGNIGDWVTTVISSWWLTVTTTVKGWIDVAVEGLSKLKVSWGDFWSITWPEWMTKFNGLATAWDTFFVTTLPTLFDVKYAEEWWKGKAINFMAIADSQLRERFPFYDELALFFKDPGQYVYDKLDDFFERFW
jgi:hypothetical protein